MVWTFHINQLVSKTSVNVKVVIQQVIAMVTDSLWSRFTISLPKLKKTSITQCLYKYVQYSTNTIWN